MKLLALKNPADEELFNGLTHAAGILLGLISTVMLCRRAAETGSVWSIVSALVFTLSLTLMYISSTLYHLSKNEAHHKTLQIIDHCAIYVSIAGTYTPFCLVTLREVGSVGWGLFAVVWTAALTGIGISIYKTRGLSLIKTLCYIAMGSLVLIAYSPFVTALAREGKQEVFCWILYGGAFYLGGTLFYMLGRYRYMHPIWHLFVLGGSLCHMVAIYLLF